MPGDLGLGNWARFHIFFYIFQYIIVNKLLANVHVILK